MQTYRGYLSHRLSVISKQRVQTWCVPRQLLCFAMQDTSCPPPELRARGPHAFANVLWNADTAGPFTV